MVQDVSQRVTLRDIGKITVALMPWLDRVFRWAYARLPESFHDTPTSRLRNIFSEQDTVTFLQVGAFDGKTGDPIWSLVSESDRWRGVLVEPQETAFRKLKDNYGGLSNRLAFINAVVSECDDEVPFYDIPEEEIRRLGLPDWAQEVASLHELHLLKHFPEAKIRKRMVQSISMSKAAEMSGYDHLDVIVMDVEGYECPLIKMIDFEGLRVKCVLYEHTHLAGNELKEIEKLLRSHSFSIKKFGRDCLAYR